MLPHIPPGGSLLPEEFPQFFAQPVYRETLSRREEELHDRLGGDLPHPFSLWSNLAHGKEKAATSATAGFPRPCAVARYRCACSARLLRYSYGQGGPARRAGWLPAR